MQFLILMAFSVLYSWPVMAHEAGVTDTHVRIGAKDVRIVYTLPNEALTAIQDRTIIKAGFQLKNNDVFCKVSEFNEKPLDNIDSTQFYYLMSCDETLDNIAVFYRMFTHISDHKNIVRLSILGRHQVFIYTSVYRKHELPIKNMIHAWGPRAEEQVDSESMIDVVMAEIQKSTPYFSVGFFHILQGYDHILFLLGLLLLPMTLKNLMAISVTFTLAHSITLGLSVVRDINIPSYLIESAIALSIVYVGAENICRLKNNQMNIVGIDVKRLFIIFIFGLIHGFGFSYLLKEIGFSDQILSSLLFFNLGVEVGQVVIISAAMPLLWWLIRIQSRAHYYRLGSAFIMLLGSAWLFERLG